MRATILLLFTVLASSAAFGQGKTPPAPPTDTYTDAETGFVFPVTVGMFRRGMISHVKDPTALWVDYGDVSHRAKFTIRIVVRKPQAGPDGIASCQTDMNKTREQVRRWPYFAGFSTLKRLEFAGYTSTAWAEEFGPQRRAVRDMTGIVIVPERNLGWSFMAFSVRRISM